MKYTQYTHTRTHSIYTLREKGDESSVTEITNISVVFDNMKKV